MNFIQNLSIRRKLVSIIMLTSSTSLLLAVLAFVALDLKRIRKSILDKQSSQAEILTYNCTAALSFGHKNTAEKILASLKYQKDMKTPPIFRAI